MKFSQLSLLAAAVATVNGAVVTVTQHVHQGNPLRVQGIVYVENGQTHTTYTSLDSPATAVAEEVVTTSVAPVEQVAQTTSAAAAAPSSKDTTTVSPPTTTETPAEATTSEAPTTEATTTEAPTTEDSTTEAPTTTETPTKASSTEASTTEAAATTVSSSASSSTSSPSSDFASSILNAHNSKRSLHKDTPSLSWSDELASYAQAYADKYDCSGTLTHSGGPYGENLALGYDVTGSVDAWYNEIDSYDYSNPSFSSGTGHFTQVVWKSSTQVGCGIKKCNNAWGSYVICSYNPAGNFIGRFADNVEPLK